MPRISLVVCLKGERDLLQRLLAHANECFDDLVVVHDGPVNWCRGPAANQADQFGEPERLTPEQLSLVAPSAPVSSIARDYATIVPGGDAPAGYRLVDTTPLEGSIHDLVSIHRGRFYEGPLCFQQEPHWPFAWSRAAHDWILRLDADEFPSGELRSFLQSFRKQSVERAETAGFACVWPFWDGKKATTRNWPNDRLFLFNRRKVKFFGMAEQTPIPQGKVERRKEVLRHEPHGKRYGLRKVIMRKQAGRWRRVIAESLLESPLSLPRWQWREAEWPEGWQRLRGQPIREAFCRLLLMPIHQAREMRRTGNRVDLSACYGSAVQHFLLGLLYWTLARSRSRTMHRLVTSNQ